MTPRIVLITDPAFDADTVVRCIEAAASVLPAGSFAVQLRDKRAAPAPLQTFAQRLRAVTRDVGADLIVNGNAPLARDVGAEGVHLGRGADSVALAREVVGHRAWVSVAAHSDDDVAAALHDNADAVLVSPIFSTSSPPIEASPSEKRGRGLDAVRAARALAARRLMVFALGGVTPANAASCAAAGADGVAIMKALLASPSPDKVAAAIHDALLRGW